MVKGDVEAEDLGLEGVDSGGCDQSILYARKTMP